MESRYGTGQLDPDSTEDMTGGEVDEVAAARMQVEETRCSIGSTLEAIKDKLDPHAIAQQAKETAADVVQHAKESAVEVVDHARGAMYDATIGRAQHAVEGTVDTVRGAGSNVADFVRENPVPVAMIGLGLAWLLMSRRSESRRDTYRGYGGYHGGADDPAYDRGYDSRSRYDPGYMGEAGDAIRRRASQAGERVSAAVDEVRDRAGEVVGETRARAGEVIGQARERAGEMVDRAQQRVGETAEQARERAADAAERARYQAKLASMQAREVAHRSGDALQNLVQENPIAVAAIALGLGAAVGMLLPSTEPESRLMGETRDRLVDRAQDVAQDVKERAQTAAKQAVDTVKEQVRESGIIDRAKDVVQQTAETVKQQAAEQGQEVVQSVTGSMPGAGSITGAAGTTGFSSTGGAPTQAPSADYHVTDVREGDYQDALDDIEETETSTTLSQRPT
jgi:ElaB/YqjD/DUF883 family membrane-anchored ribosome-binding protein